MEMAKLYRQQRMENKLAHILQKKIEQINSIHILDTIHYVTGTGKQFASGKF